MPRKVGLDSLRTYQDAVVIITGGASRLGKHIGLELAKRGANVVLLDRQVEEAKRVCAQINEAGGRGWAHEIDVREQSAIRTVFRRVYEEHGRIDYVFNNAGIVYAGNVTDMTPAQWKDIVDINICGVVSGCHEAVAIMKEQGFGHIINTASMAGLLITPFITAYGMTKHAVVGLSLAMNAELRAENIWVTAMCPGFINTPILHGGEYGAYVSKTKDGVLEKLRSNKFIVYDVESFAKDAVKAITKRKGIIILPKRWTLVWCFHRWFPGFSLALSQLQSRYTKKKKVFRP